MKSDAYSVIFKCLQTEARLRVRFSLAIESQCCPLIGYIFHM